VIEDTTPEKIQTQSVQDPHPRQYIALARRYRPRRFSEIIGQAGITQTLANTIENGRVHHAYLFSGPRGIGKTTAARVLAHSLTKNRNRIENKDSKKENEPLYRSPDIIEIDGASHTGVDDIRTLRDGTHYLPIESAYKVYIIDEVHMLSTSAFNALLKTLEEPPSHVVFILATTEIRKIPATVRSRCQQYDFRKVSQPEIVLYLKSICAKEQVVISVDCLEVVAHLCDGCVRDSLSLLDQLLATGITSPTDAAEFFGVASQSQLNSITRALLENDHHQIIETTQTWQRSGVCPIETAKRLTLQIYHLYLFAQSKHENTSPKTQHQKDVLEAILPKTFNRDFFDQSTSSKGSLDPPLSKLNFLFIALDNISTRIVRSTLPHESLTLNLIDLAQNSDDFIKIDEIADKVLNAKSRIEDKPALSPSKRSSEKLSRFSSPPPPSSHESSEYSSAAPPATVIPEESSNNNQKKVANHKQSSEKKTFQRFQDLLKSIDSAASSAYLSGYLMRWENNEIEIGFPSGSFDLDRASNPERIKLVSEQISTQIGQKTTIRIIGLTEDKIDAGRALNRKTIVEIEEEKNKQLQETRRESILNHNITMKVQSQLGGKLESIRAKS